MVYLVDKTCFFTLLQTIALLSGLCKLNVPTDLGEDEKCVCCRQRLIEEKLLKCYAEEVTAIISMMVLENCEGCRVDYASQRQHDCLMMEDDQKMWLYFDSSLDKVSEAKVVETVMNSLRDLKPTVDGLALLKYTCQDWRTLLFTKNRGLLKRQILAHAIISNNIEHCYLRIVNY